MGFTAADLTLARDRVAESERRILRQRYVLEQLNEAGRPSANATALLRSLLARLGQYREELTSIEADFRRKHDCMAREKQRQLRARRQWWNA
jgi:hypothetical protein